MATLAAQPDNAGYSTDQSFFVKLAIALAAIIVFGFAQNAALGRVNIPAMPIWVHLHGIAMLGWLGLLVTQNRLAASGNLALHRRLGWIGAFLVCAIVGLACFAGVMALGLHRTPPFFSDAYFISLVTIDTLAFAGLVLAGVVNRADTQTHRRLILGGTIVLLEPALGRLLPMPLLGGETGEWVVMVIQLGFVGLMALHDRKVLGRVHPATASAGLVVALSHVLVSLASRAAPVIALAASIAHR